LYSRQSSIATYHHLATLADGLLAAGWPVIVDAAFLQRDQRDLFRDLAVRCAVPFQILDCQAAPTILRERIRQRTAEGLDASEADLSVLQYQMDTAQPLGADELVVVLNSSQAAQGG
jgi:predicted kinase